jgi:signal transduction histidine kinase
VSTKGKSIEALYIVLSGRIAISVDRGAGPHKVMEWREGDVTGLLPYSRMVTAPGDSVAQEATDLFAIGREHHHDMIRECDAVTAIMVHLMLDRARVFNAADLHDEKMVSLGRLSAGLAHELNNPASAIERSAALLDQRLDDNERATRGLGAGRLSDAQLSAIDDVRRSCVATKTRGVRSPLEQGEREEAMADWLDEHGVDAAIGDTLAETAVTIEGLDRLATVVDGPVLGDVLRWVASACSVRSLATEIQESATRISGLVSAIKGFSHMDQAVVAEPVDLVQGLENTVTVLRSKAGRKSATVAIDVEPDLPKARGFAGELNQIWLNLIDNALDAIADGGRVDVRVGRERDRVVVRVIDNGGGIPEQVRDRIFDPFFTTKPFGAGTGLGLDIVRRLVRHNDAEIDVESKPGRTEFRVALPAIVSDGPAIRA